MKIHRTNVGITLVELVVTLAIASILVGFGVPGVSTLLKNNRTTANVSDILSALNYARSEAIKRGAQVTLCTANATFTDCSGSANWEKGWLIFSDPPANDGNIAVANGAEILQIGQGLAGANTTLRTPTLLANKTHLAYHGDGTVRDKLTGLLAPRTYALCDDRLLTDGKKFARKIILNKQGRARALAAGSSSGPAVNACT